MEQLKAVALPSCDKIVGTFSTMAKIGRNDPCFCGSGKKYKKCHAGNRTAGGPGTSGTSRAYSRIEDHIRQGKSLVPPFLTIPNLKPMSWMNERLPELLWAALLVTLLPREDGLSVFRGLADFVHSLAESERFSDVTHSGLAALTTEKFRTVLVNIVSSPTVAVALSPLLLFDDLQGAELWKEVLSGAEQRLDWDALKATVARTLFHQSAEATDCRWLRVLVAVVAGKLVLPRQSPEIGEEILRYPHYGDLRKVRPSIRAMEGNLGAFPQSSTNWPNEFWQQCMKDTACFPLSASEERTKPAMTVSHKALKNLYEKLVKHCNISRITTSVDSRHDTVFGVALYCLGIVQDLLQPEVGVSLIARSALRTLTECCITLAYLLRKESPELWKSYRAYGAGQAKLSFLKLEAAGDKPTSIDAQTLESLANEDAWQELVPIDLGHWDKSDLRKMSEEAGVKSIYDTFYGWTSTYAHGHWFAVRDSVFDTCGNPLHRLHRIPRQEIRQLPDVVPDACLLVDEILNLLSRAYPKFDNRLLAGTQNA